jgi:hypothetical protein
MREEARIQIRGDKAAFQTAWNSRFDPKIEYGLVVINKDDPAYAQMRQLFDRFATEHSMTWHERVHVEYSQQELESFEILRLIVTGRAGPGDNAYAPVYRTERLCSVCGREVRRQVRNLVVDLSLGEDDPQETGYFQHDLCRTEYGEVLVSHRVTSLLESEGVPRMTIRRVETVRPADELSIRYYQMVVEAGIGRVLPPSRVQLGALCPECGQHKEALLDAMPGSRGSELYFARSALPLAWIMRTAEDFGRGPMHSPELIIKQEFYRLLRDGRVTGFWVEPAHLV